MHARFTRSQRRAATGPLAAGLLGLMTSLMSLPAAATPAPAGPAAACPTLLQQSYLRLQDEKPQSLCQYRGKVLLVVNTASFCGFTPQYEGLEKLNARYAERGLVVLGFPSNDFGQQEPGDGKAIADFCSNTYGVRFPMFTKSVVSGREANPLFAALAKTTGQPPTWNFHKYLIGRNGRVLASFDSNVAPGSPALVAAVEKALAAKP